MPIVPVTLAIWLSAVAAGMALVDTLDGVVMLGAYQWAFVKPIRKLYYNVTITLISALVAIVIGGIETLALTRAAWGQLASINAHVNAAIEPVTDMEQYGQEEVWTYPLSGRGDCEDYVLLKKQMLIRAGLPASALLITVVRDRKGEGHAILTVRTDRGDYVLDNETDDIRLWHETGYRFVKRQSREDPNRWVTIGPASAPAAVASQ